MRTRHVLIGSVLTMAFLSFPPAGPAQEKPEMSPEEAAMMAAWVKASTPNENHQRLAAFEGTWDFTSRWWGEPGAPPQESKGTSTFEMILGGRYLRETVTSQMMDGAFEGVGYSAYNNLKGAYESTWIDNMGTGIMVYRGVYDEGAKTYTWTGDYIDAMSGKPATMRIVTRIESRDRRVAEFYQPGADGAEYKAMELNYKRR